MSVAKDNIYEKKIDNISPFAFNQSTVDVFDDMAKRSIPGYVQMQETVAAFAEKFYIPGTNIYDVGCSTGNTILSIAEKVEAFDSLKAFDNSSAMVEQAKEKCSHIANVDFFVSAAEDVVYENASFVSMIYVLQFIDPAKRKSIVQSIYDSLQDGGVFILAEKLFDKNPDVQSMTDKLYYDYKAKRGYSQLEIKQKEKALKGVLVPYTMEDYQDLLASVGFKTVSIFLKYFNFTGFVALK